MWLGEDKYKRMIPELGYVDLKNLQGKKKKYHFVERVRQEEGEDWGQWVSRGRTAGNLVPNSGNLPRT